MLGEIFIWVIVFVWLAIITFFLVKLLGTLKKITKGVSQKDIRVILEELLRELKKSGEMGLELEKKIEGLRKEGLGYIQKTGFVRYNPFSETGGNQSFVLALLDAEDNGFVVTSLHSREATRVFAKPVKAGKEDGFEFSKEEIQAILSAAKRKSK